MLLTAPPSVNGSLPIIYSKFKLATVKIGIHKEICNKIFFFQNIFHKMAKYCHRRNHHRRPFWVNCFLCEMSILIEDTSQWYRPCSGSWKPGKKGFEFKPSGVHVKALFYPLYHCP
jgi:hypothetical protein